MAVWVIIDMCHGCQEYIYSWHPAIPSNKALEGILHKVKPNDFFLAFASWYYTGWFPRFSPLPSVPDR